jgi:hypothetical protein
LIEAGSRTWNQPSSPHVVVEALTEPYRDRSRQWLFLLDDDVPPEVLEMEQPRLVVWSSLWSTRPDARIRFDLPSDGRFGNDMCWSLSVDEPMPEASLFGHLRKRMNLLVDVNLRFPFGE